MPRPAVTIAVRAARAAGNIILRYMNRVEGLAVEEKARHDYVSEVDKMAEAEIVKELRRAYPDHAFLGEETGSSGKSNKVWVIDPLDGTHNYLHGFPHFCVSIGFLDHGTKRENLTGALLCTGFPYRQRKHLDAQLAMTRALLNEAEDIRRTGSAALDLAYVAAGRLDGYFEIGLKPWDMTAGCLLVREAGGTFSDFAGRAGIPASGNLLAGNHYVTGAMVKAIAAHAGADLLKA
jgi:myo-inositol-1(or 4)-monophosphatase